jgi:Uma2 family endonuclease
MDRAMSAAVLPRMTAEEFIAWAKAQPETAHYELRGGVVVEMAAERVAHVRAKQRIVRLLADAIAAAGLPCEAFVHGLAVKIDRHTVLEPDALLRCGATLGDDVVLITDPLVVVEVVSPSSHARDTDLTLVDYFRLAALRHYLIVLTDRRVVIHHRRDEAGDIHTKIVRDGTVALDPPGIVIAGIFPDAPAFDAPAPDAPDGAQPRGR